MAIHIIRRGRSCVSRGGLSATPAVHPPGPLLPVPGAGSRGAGATLHDAGAVPVVGTRGPAGIPGGPRSPALGRCVGRRGGGGVRSGGAAGAGSSPLRPPPRRVGEVTRTARPRGKVRSGSSGTAFRLRPACPLLGRGAGVNQEVLGPRRGATRPARAARPSCSKGRNNSEARPGTGYGPAVGNPARRETAEGATGTREPTARPRAEPPASGRSGRKRL